MAIIQAIKQTPAAFKWTALDVEIAVALHFDYRVNLIVPNISHGLDFYWQEIDVLVATKLGYLTEVEIKVSASDLRADAKKRHGHPRKRFKQQFFAVPEKLALLALEVAPPDWGVLTCARDEWARTLVATARRAAINREAPPLGAAELDQLRRLGALRLWPLKQHLQKRILRDRIREVC